MIFLNNNSSFSKVWPAYSLIIFIPFQVFLDHRPRDEVRQLVSARTNGATPLVLSCRNGHKDVVEYLVERCNADVEQAGIKNNCQFAMDHHKNKTFKNIISWWQLSVFWDFARLLKPIIVNLYVDYFDDLFFLNVIVSVWSTLAHLLFGRNAIFWGQQHLLGDILFLKEF